MEEWIRDRKECEKQAKLFREFIRKSKFDKSSVKQWELKVLEQYLKTNRRIDMRK